MHIIRIYFLFAQRVGDVIWNNKYIRSIIAYPELKQFLQDLHARTTVVKKRNKKQILSAQEIDACRAVLETIHAMYNILSAFVIQYSRMKKSKFSKSVRLQVSIILKAMPSTWCFPKQRINDIQLELLRLEYIVSLYYLFSVK